MASAKMSALESLVELSKKDSRCASCCVPCRKLGHHNQISHRSTRDEIIAKARYPRGGQTVIALIEDPNGYKFEPPQRLDYQLASLLLKFVCALVTSIGLSLFTKKEFTFTAPVIICVPNHHLKMELVYKRYAGILRRRVEKLPWWS